MKKTLLHILLLMLPSLAAVAQQRIYVCQGTRCEAFETRNIIQITFAADSFRVDGRLPYAKERVDSIVFCQPQLATELMGWEGDLAGGEAHYRDVLTDTTHHFNYHVEFIVSVSDSICQSAQCRLTFDEQWQMEAFTGEKPTDASNTDNNPYIYVKGSQTGPRKFELWVMGDPVLPADCTWQTTVMQPCVLTADCSSQLGGCTMNEVRLIIEAWLYQPAQVIENPFYNGDNP